MKKAIYILIVVLFVGCENCNEMTHEEYLETGKYIWQNFVPKSGQAELVQGELVRAVAKLRDEAQRNGNINFNEKCHGILIAYLRTKLSDHEIFNSKTILQINTDLDRLSLEGQPYTDDELFDRLDERVVDWYMCYGDEITHKNNADLYC